MVRVGAVLLLLLVLAAGAFAQRAAVYAPDGSPSSIAFADALSGQLSEKLAVLDVSLVTAAYMAAPPKAPFNMTREEGRRLAAAIGCDLLVLVRSSTLRRSSSARTEYYEANAFVFVVSGRNGRLVLWKPLKYESASATTAETQLYQSIEGLAPEIANVWAITKAREVNEPSVAAMDGVPETDPPASERFRAPIPYRRIKPEHTAEAAYYDVAATVEITVDLAADGTILRTEIERWAGFGLDQSVERAVRAMNWRPAERKGQAIPMRFLLRYNFRETDKDKK